MNYEISELNQWLANFFLMHCPLLFFIKSPQVQLPDPGKSVFSLVDARVGTPGLFSPLFLPLGHVIHLNFDCIHLFSLYLILALFVLVLLDFTNLFTYLRV